MIQKEITLIGGMIKLDISGRQTGKTTRMIEYILDHYQEYNKIVIFGWRNSFNAYIKDSLSKLYYKRNNLVPENSHKELEKKIIFTDYGSLEVLRGLNSEETLYCFDEFEFVRDDFKLPYFENGYYNTTPNNGVHFNSLKASMPKNMKYKTPVSVSSLTKQYIFNFEESTVEYLDRTNNQRDFGRLWKMSVEDLSVSNFLEINSFIYEYINDDIMYTIIEDNFINDYLKKKPEVRFMLL